MREHTEQTKQTQGEQMPTTRERAIKLPPILKQETLQDKQVRSAGDSAAKQPSILKELFYLLLKIAVIIGVFFLILTFLFGLLRTSDLSMSPAVKGGDLVLFYRLDRDYMPQDIVVLEYQGTQQVSRVIATAGDTVNIDEKGLWINGAIQQEMFITSATERFEGGVKFPLVVPEGHVFVLGDNRVNATDSRIFGTVAVDDTLGKVTAIIRWRDM